MAQKKKSKPSLKEGLKEDLRLFTRGAKAGVGAASTLIPTGRAISVAASVISNSKAKKISSGEPTVKKKSFTQGDRARITNTPPKKTGTGKNSPVKGTKVEVSYKTKKINPKVYAQLTTGNVVRKRGGLAAAAAKGAAAMYSASQLKKVLDEETKKKKKGK
jgi:hypothetical protein